MRPTRRVGRGSGVRFGARGPGAEAAREDSRPARGFRSHSRAGRIARQDGGHAVCWAEMSDAQPRPSGELARTALQLLALGTLLVTSLWIVRPFLLAGVWATMIAVATW